MSDPDLADFTDEVKARFWTNVERHDDDACWHWTGTKHSQDGRGTFYMGRNIVASRAALIIAKGLPPDPRMYACHSCDNPPCVNPAHLWWGTCSQNMQDASAKGRLRNNQVTHCPQGHPYAGANLAIVKGKYRRCLSCTRASRRARRARTALADHRGGVDG